MLKRTASMGEAEVQATLESKMKNVAPPLNRDFDISLPRSSKIWTLHASRFTSHEPLGIS